MGVAAQVVSKILWLACALGAVLASLNWTLSNPTTAPQQAVIAAQACALAIIPYVFARAWDNLFFEPLASARSRPKDAAPEE